MTATITFNLTQDGEAKITLEKAIPVTVAGQEDQRRIEMQAALDKYTMDKLTYANGENKGKPIDPAAVTANIQLLRPRNLGLDGRQRRLRRDGHRPECRFGGYEWLTSMSTAIWQASSAR